MYIRQRPRLVRQSVWDDVMTALGSLGWLPDDPSGHSLLRGNPLVFRDAFPESAAEQGDAIAPNTFVMDEGEPGETYPWEMGGGLMAQPYVFTFGFYAISDAVALALLQDLKDVFLGLNPFQPTHEGIVLYDYSAATPTGVTTMEVEAFRFNRSPDEDIGFGFELYLAELELTDFLDS